MSNRRRMPNPLAHMDGARIDGGCLTCDAWTDVKTTTYGSSLTVCHDDDCPTWLGMQK